MARGASSIRDVLRADDERQLGRRRGRRQALAYQGAFESVFAILIGAGFGYLADARFDSAPWGLLVGVVLGFAAFVLRLIRLTRRLEGMAQEEHEGESAEDAEAAERAERAGPDTEG